MSVEDAIEKFKLAAKERRKFLDREEASFWATEFFNSGLPMGEDEDGKGPFVIIHFENTEETIKLIRLVEKELEFQYLESDPIYQRAWCNGFFEGTISASNTKQ